MHEIPGDRRGDDKGDGDGPEEVEGQHPEYAHHPCAQHFPDANLFLALFRRKGGEAQETHPGNGNGDDHGQPHQRRDAPFLLIEIGDGLIEEGEGELFVRIDRLSGLFHLRENRRHGGLLPGFGCESDAYLSGTISNTSCQFFFSNLQYQIQGRRMQPGIH
jgi:hypothetical protein